ncbi:MAG: biotin--[acetyl-CoA-carboxylase] ligase [Candidatus Kapabacteria bacterium]|nr:biotin--[acetyl-CoA-carboxylase] ligase [Candidatus Kapabacteria bacterium]
MKHFHYQSVSSTNEVAKDLLEFAPMIAVSADYQTHGRGRSSRVWSGESGANLYCSFGIKYENGNETEKILLLQAIAALAVKKSLIDCYGTDIFKLKWPNDIFALNKRNDYKKISGILIENGFQGDNPKYSIVGIGINVNQMNFNQDLSETAVSLALLGCQTDVSQLFNIVKYHFLEYYQLNNSEIFSQWEMALSLKNKRIKLVSTGKYCNFVKLLQDGRLLLTDPETNHEQIIDDNQSIRYEFD